MSKEKETLIINSIRDHDGEYYISVKDLLNSFYRIAAETNNRAERKTLLYWAKQFEGLKDEQS